MDRRRRHGGVGHPGGTAPNTSDTLTSFEGPTNWADNYGTRFRGYLTAPDTGNYTFWIASDENSELWLSTDDRPANKVKIAEVTSSTGSREWNKFASQKSVTIHLIGGRQYYVEALHKEGTGDDHVAVASADRANPPVRPPKSYPGRDCSPYVPRGSGSISREVWTGVAGSTVSSIPVGSAPNVNDTLTKFEGPSDWADDYGTRISGYITAPYTGSYTFWIASDDNSELWLSTSDQPANKVKVAGVTGWTPARAWNTFASQKSASINLIAGNRYYIEALQKEGAGGDNLAVGWAKPGESASSPSEVIPGAQLSPYVLVPAAPVISTLNPADNATGVAVGANLVATFSETIAIGTGNITVKNLTDGTQTTIAVTDTAQVSISGAVLTINPTANLVAGKNYAVQIAATAIKDLANNAFAGIANDTTWNFATARPPQVAINRGFGMERWRGTSTRPMRIPKSLVTVNLSQTEDSIADNTTEIYTGQIYDADGHISFTERHR